MKKTFMTLIMFVLVSTVVLAGCGNGGNNKPAANNMMNEATPTPEAIKEPELKAEPFTVSLRHIQIGEAQKFRKAILDDVVAMTEAEVEGLTFELDGVEDSVNRFTKLPAEMAAGNLTITRSITVEDATGYATADELTNELGLVKVDVTTR